MFPSNSFSDLHLHYTERTLVTERSVSPFTSMAYDLGDELIFEQLMLQEEQVNEVRNDGDINFTGSCNTNDGVDQAGLLASADRSLQQKVRPSRKIRSKVTGSSKSQLMPRKRTGKTDRHSKIHTAQGLRDRRIRLSVHIARRFFDLQEMLGLDKASKTIEWLLAESREAIDELSKQNCSHLNTDSTPESAMESEIKEAEVEEEVDEGQESGGSKSKKVCEVQVTNCIKRDSRDKVRAREKLMMNELNLEHSKLPVHQEENPNGASLDGGFLCTPENVRDSDDFSARGMNSLGIIEKFLGITSTATSSSPVPNFNIGDDYYEMIGGVGFLNGLNQPKYSNSVSGTTPN